MAKEMTGRAYKLGPNPAKGEVRAAWLARRPVAGDAA